MPKIPSLLRFQELSWKDWFYRCTVGFFIKLLRRSDGSINHFIFNLVDIRVPPSQQPLHGVQTFDTVVDATRHLWFCLYVPYSTSSAADNNKQQPQQLPVIVYFHGGGFAYFSAATVFYDHLCRKLCKETGAVVISINYRLTPKHKYPCQYEDGFDVLKFIDDNINRRGSNLEHFPTYANLNQCFLAGDSAGGNLAHHVAVKACSEPLRNVKLIGVIAIQPSFGGKERTESEVRLVDAPVLGVKGTDWFWNAYLPPGSDRDHPASNVFGPYNSDSRRLKSLPAVIVFAGGLDPLHDWQIKYHQGLNKCGNEEADLIEYPNGFHAFFLNPHLPETVLLIEDVKHFIRKQQSSANNQ